MGIAKSIESDIGLANEINLLKIMFSISHPQKTPDF